jgi:hypothetical protein
MHLDLSAGEGGGSGDSPSAILDATIGKLLIVTTNEARGGTPGLFTLGLW